MENQEKMMRIQESKGLVDSLNSYFMSPNDFVGKSNGQYRLYLAQLENNIRQGNTLEDIGITQDELKKFKDHLETFI